MTDEIQKKLDELGTGISAIQEINDRNAKKLDCLDIEQINKINDDVTKSIDSINDLKEAQKKLEEQNINIEKLICRMDAGENSTEINPLEKKSRHEFANYLRNPRDVKLSKEVIEYGANHLMEKYFIGGSDEQRMNFKAMMVQDNPNGGYLVRPQISDIIIDRIFETSQIRQYANIITTFSDSVQFLIDDNEAECLWVGEDEARNDTNTPAIGEETIHIHEMMAQPKITQKMIDDATIDVESWLAKKVSRSFSRKENRAFVVGNGNKKPRGFLDYDAWTTPGTYERGKLEHITATGTAGSLDNGDDVKKLQNALLEDYQPNAIWAMQRKTFGDVVLLKDGNERYLLDPNSFKVGDTKILLGSPVAFFADMPSVANNALAVAYGDFSVGYTIIDRIGIRVLPDPYTKTPYTVYKTTKRVGGGVTNFQSIKVLKINAT
jgi:HK97 family phage major capsid protein